MRLIQCKIINRLDAGAQACDCNTTVVGSIPKRGNELLFRFSEDTLEI